MVLLSSNISNDRKEHNPLTQLLKKKIEADTLTQTSTWMYCTDQVTDVEMIVEFGRCRFVVEQALPGHLLSNTTWGLDLQ